VISSVQILPNTVRDFVAIYFYQPRCVTSAVGNLEAMLAVKENAECGFTFRAKKYKAFRALCKR
jgi:hypothetical protein